MGKVNHNKLNSSDSVDTYVNRKKELILKDYDSLFLVYGRQTQIIYNFRGWTITILTIYFTFLFTVRPTDFSVIFLPGLCTILTFYFLEVAERSVMKILLQELRDLEGIFMIEDDKEFIQAVTQYEFRDLKDAKRPLKVKILNFFKSMISMKVMFWNAFLVLIYVVITFYFAHSYSASTTQNNLTTPVHKTIN